MRHLEGVLVTHGHEGVDRLQLSFLPERLEDWVGEDNSVRVIEAFVRRSIRSRRFHSTLRLFQKARHAV